MLASATVAAGPSPEFTQLLNQLRQNLDLMPASAAGDHVSDICPLLALKHGTDALKDRLVWDTINIVVIEPLNDGIKFTASALGVGTIAIAAYDVARCAYDNDKSKEMGRCLLDAAYGADYNVFGAQVGGDNNLKGALASLAAEKIDKLADELGAEYFQAAKGEVDTYQAQTERYEENIGDGRCDSLIKATWDRHRQPKSRGGAIRLLVHTQCDCDGKGGYRSTSLTGAHRLKTGFFRIEVPVLYTRATANRNAPGWTLGVLGHTRVWGGCCGNETYFNRTLDSQGNQVRGPRYPGAGYPSPTGGTTVGTGATHPSGHTSNPTPRPPTVVEPVPPEVIPIPEWNVENPCPACRSLAAELAAERQALASAEDAVDSLEYDLAEAVSDEATLRAEISTLENQLKGQQGIGGTSYDPATGITVRSYDQGNGQVKITTTHPNGTTDVRYRPRESAAAIGARIDAARKELEELQTRRSKLEHDVETLRQFVRTTRAKVEALEEELGACVRMYCLLALTMGGDYDTGLRSDPEARPAEFAYPEDQEPTVLVVELDGDGVTDIVLANPVSGEVRAYFGDGTGFPTSQRLGRIEGPVAIAAGDLNFDGFTDVVTANVLSAEVVVLQNLGGRTFQTGTPEIVDRIPRVLEIGDLTGDRIPDLRVVDETNGEGRVLEGLGDARFEASTPYEGFREVLR